MGPSPIKGSGPAHTQRTAPALRLPGRFCCFGLSVVAQVHDVHTLGLAGRGVAERMLEDAYRKGQENRDQVKQDFQTGQDRAQQRVDETRPSNGTHAEGATVSARPARPDHI